MTLFHDCYESNQTTVCLLGSIMRQFRSGVMTTIHPSPCEQNYESECPRQIPAQEAYIRFGHEITVGG